LCRMKKTNGWSARKVGGSSGRMARTPTAARRCRRLGACSSTSTRALEHGRDREVALPVHAGEVGAIRKACGIPIAASVLPRPNRTPPRSAAEDQDVLTPNTSSSGAFSGVGSPPPPPDPPSRRAGAPAWRSSPLCGIGDLHRRIRPGREAGRSGEHQGTPTAGPPGRETAGRASRSSRTAAPSRRGSRSRWRGPGACPDQYPGQDEIPDLLLGLLRDPAVDLLRAPRRRSRITSPSSAPWLVRVTA
jgi:hypothetical protein